MTTSDAPLLHELEARLIALPAAEVVLRDEGTKTNWQVAVAPFRLAAVPVTRELFAAVHGDLPQSSAGPRTPVTEVSWNEVIRFCNALSLRAGLRPCYAFGDDPEARDVTCDWEADGYRLPSEAEWEYACRAGTTGERYGDLDAIAWHHGNSGGAPHDVATREPNAWGFYDTIGNAWEWCWDVYDPKVYGPYRVFRGGGWNDRPRGLRASCRRRSHPTFRVDDLGFRLARSR